MTAGIGRNNLYLEANSSYIKTPGTPCYRAIGELL